MAQQLLCTCLLRALRVLVSTVLSLPAHGLMSPRYFLVRWKALKVTATTA